MRIDPVSICRLRIRLLYRIIFAKLFAAGHWSHTAMEHKPAIIYM